MDKDVTPGSHPPTPPAVPAQQHAHAALSAAAQAAALVHPPMPASPGSAGHAEASLAQLPDDPAALKALLLQHQQRITELELDVLLLNHRLAVALKQCYGPRADKVPLGQMLLEFAQSLEARPVVAEDLPPSTDPASVTRRVAISGKGGGRRNLAERQDLPALEHIHDLPEDQQACPTCHQPRVKIGEEVTWQLGFRPAFFFRHKHVRIKYACRPCDTNGYNPQIVLAEKPSQPIEKSLAAPELLAHVAVAKFADFTPLYRLEGIFARVDVTIDRATMCLWLRDIAELVAPLYRLMCQRVRESHVIATDDTILPMQAPEKNTPARIWIYRGDDEHPYNVFDFTLSRSRDGPAKFLAGYNQVLLADAYGGYEGICLEAGMTQAGCWSHARRKVVDSRALLPTVGDTALELVGRLFATERQADQQKLSAEDRLALRRDHSVPVVEQLHEKLSTWKSQLLPKHPLAQALGYIQNQWAPLTVFTRDGKIPIHNNLAEQQMKRMALIRKNVLMVGNERGGQTAAILSSLTSTCQRHQINPELYLTQLLVNLPDTPVSQLDQWLPDQWKIRHAADVAQGGELAEFKPLSGSTPPQATSS
jgi:transposase